MADVGGRGMTADFRHPGCPVCAMGLAFEEQAAAHDQMRVPASAGSRTASPGSQAAGHSRDPLMRIRRAWRQWRER